MRISATFRSVLAMIARARGSEVRAALRPVMMSIHRSHSADQLSGPGAAMASVTVGEAASAMADSADAVRKVRRDGVPNKGHAPRERVAALPHVQVCCPETLQESGYHCHQLDIIFLILELRDSSMVSGRV